MKIDVLRGLRHGNDAAAGILRDLRRANHMNCELVGHRYLPDEWFHRAFCSQPGRRTQSRPSRVGALRRRWHRVEWRQQTFLIAIRWRAGEIVGSEQTGIVTCPGWGVFKFPNRLFRQRAIPELQEEQLSAP